MKKLLLVAITLSLGFCSAIAQDLKAEIKFDKTIIDLGEFSEASPVQSCVFSFTNVGNAPLIINQAIASCGCTVPSYTKKPIGPGEKGEIKVTYNGKGKFPGHFKKSISVMTNGNPETTRIYIQGNMSEQSAGKTE